MRYRVLVVDDDREMRESLSHLLSSGGFEVDTLPRAQDVKRKLRTRLIDAVLCDVRMPGMSGIELLRELKGVTTVPIILISAHGDIPMAVDAMQDGAYSFLEKPFEPRRLLKVLDNAARSYRLSQDAERLKARLASLSGLDRILIGQSSRIESLRQEVLDLSDSDTTTLLLGETGTGKELVARALHDLGPRAAGPFVPVNCAAIPLGQFEKTLFGEYDVAEGVLKHAHRGTLFLDELGAIPLEAQTKLLRVIEDKEFTQVGGFDTVRSDFRIISSCNEAVDDAVAAGRLREDLYFRLNAVIVDLPPLRERLEDIPLLYEHFLARYASIYEIAAPETTADDLAVLMAHAWPGNVRELRSVCERRVLAARRGLGSAADAMRLDADHEDVPETLRHSVAAFERQLIAKALHTHQGRMDSVAEALGISRRTLNEKIVKLGLNKADLLP